MATKATTKRATSKRPAAKKPAARDTAAAKPAKATRSDRNTIHLRLYIAGQTRKSLQAVANLRNFCEANLAGRYSIEVVDLLLHPELARSDQILAIPTLVRRLPAPIKKIIGDLSRTDKVLLGLDIETRVDGQ